MMMNANFMTSGPNTSFPSASHEISVHHHQRSPYPLRERARARSRSINTTATTSSGTAVDGPNTSFPSASHEISVQRCADALISRSIPDQGVVEWEKFLCFTPKYEERVKRVWTKKSAAMFLKVAEYIQMRKNRGDESPGYIKRGVVTMLGSKRFDMGGWSNSTRSRWYLGQLPGEKIEMLKEIEFERGLGPRQQVWDGFYARLKAFWEEYEHSDVPHKYEKDPSLGEWVHNQR